MGGVSADSCGGSGCRGRRTDQGNGAACDSAQHEGKEAFGGHRSGVGPGTHVFLCLFFLGRPTAGLRVSGCTFWGACSSQSHRSPPSLDEGTKEVTDVRSNPKKFKLFSGSAS